jgi:hypothetical protein
LKTEFGFDTEQVAKNRYASDKYHDFIGFEVSKPLLERVFPVVYGLKLSDVLAHEDLAVGSYRFAISRLIPKMTRVALQIHKKEMLHEMPNSARRKFLYRLSRSDYERQWGKEYIKPGIGTRILSAILRIMPKIGPFKGLAFNNPTPQTEDLYIKSINTTVDQYRSLLQRQRAGSLALSNVDLDSGHGTRAADYSLTDDTYADLLTKLSSQEFTLATPELRDNLLTFFSDLSLPFHTKSDHGRWKKTLSSLDRLKATPAVNGAVANSAVAPPAR